MDAQLQTEEPWSIADFLWLRPWKHALFTTYTLSLSYFESEVLRPLLHGGCQDIWVIADAEGYRSSLLERRSMQIGQSYRLVPMRLPNGLLHAKCIYLSSEEGDLLLVGSGNVTFAGHGKSAEVFEALTPDIHPAAFEDFANFLEAMRRRADIVTPNSLWIDEFSSRARRAFRTSTSDNSGEVRLLHSIDRPVLDQLAETFSAMGECQSIKIMSPYHDPDGFCLRQMIDRLKPELAAVAVTDEDETPFPFEAAKSWPIKIRFQRPALGDSERFVHAKWYEFVFDSGSALLTGSINATRKALTTADNIELGALRIGVADDDLLVWTDAAAPNFTPQTRLPPGINGTEIIYANFDRRDSRKLYGTLIFRTDPQGIWLCRVVGPDGDTVTTQLNVAENGEFKAESEELGSISEFPALQIVLIRPDREARGWIHNEAFLAVSGKRRLTPSALSRLFRREALDDDIEALLDYLSQQANTHLRIFDKPVMGGQAGDAPPRSADTVTVNLSELTPSTIEQEQGKAPSNSFADDDLFTAAMIRLRRMLLGHGRSRSATTVSSAASDADDSDKSSSKDANDPAESLGLNDFEETIYDLITALKANPQPSSNPQSINGLLVIWLETGMWFRLYRLGDKDRAHEFLSHWFHEACKLVRPEAASISAISQHIFTAAAILMKLSERAELSNGYASDLHGMLEHYCRGTVDASFATSNLLPEGVGFAEAMLGEFNETDTAGAIVRLLSRPTHRRQLVDALALAKSGREIPSDWDIFSSHRGRELLEAFRSPSWEKKVRISPHGSPSCAFQYYALSKDEVSYFERLRIARCIHCRKFTLNVQP